jgi:hypothetical protein
VERARYYHATLAARVDRRTHLVDPHREDSRQRDWVDDTSNYVTL